MAQYSTYSPYTSPGHSVFAYRCSNRRISVFFFRLKITKINLQEFLNLFTFSWIVSESLFSAPKVLTYPLMYVAMTSGRLTFLLMNSNSILSFFSTNSLSVGLFRYSSRPFEAPYNIMAICTWLLTKEDLESLKLEDSSTSHDYKGNFLLKLIKIER